MNRQSFQITAATKALLITALGTTLLAGSANAELATQRSMADNHGSAIQGSSRNSSKLRCWQYGGLLFEQSHLKARKLSEDNTVLVFEDDGSTRDRELHLIDLGTATCLYEKI